MCVCVCVCVCVWQVVLTHHAELASVAVVVEHMPSVQTVCVCVCVCVCACVCEHGKWFC